MSAPVLRSAPGLSSPALLGGLSTRLGFSRREVDDEASRQAHRAELAYALGRRAAALAWCRQVHGDAVLEVRQAGLQGEADALFCTKGGFVLLVSVADCCPVLLWDSAGPAIAVAHAGWRGVVAGVLPNAVAALRQTGITPERLRAWVGPSIGVDNFEVGEEVASRFDARFVRRSGGKPHVDLKAAAAHQLRASGLGEDAVRICPDDTYARAELYWSYRRDRGICGRNLGYLARGAAAQ